MLNSFHSFESIRLLHLYKNPWHCTCRLRWLRVWIEAAKITYDFDEKAKVTRFVFHRQEFIQSVANLGKLS